MLDALLLVEDGQALHALTAEPQQRAQDQAGMRSPEAEMFSGTETEMWIGLPIEAHLVGVGEDAFIEVGG